MGRDGHSAGPVERVVLHGVVARHRLPRMAIRAVGPVIWPRRMDKGEPATFALVPGLVAWAVSPPASRARLLRLVSSLPFPLALAALNVVLRLAMVGSLGSYSEARTDYGSFEWDHLNAYLGRLIAPINPAIMGEAAVQVVGLPSALLLIGLVLFGRDNRRMLALAAGVGAADGLACNQLAGCPGRKPPRQPPAVLARGGLHHRRGGTALRRDQECGALASSSGWRHGRARGPGA